VNSDLPAGLELRVELDAGVADRLSCQRSRAQPQPGAGLVGQHQLVLGRWPGGGRRLLGRFGHAEDRVEHELGRAADDLHGLLGVVDAGQLHDHPPVARALQGGLGHPELVDPAPQHL
jgi:hypothetical protein